MRLHRVGVVTVASAILAACAATGAGESDARRLPKVPRQAPTATLSPTPTPTPPPELPRGGRTVFPEHRLVGFSGGRGESLEPDGGLALDAEWAVGSGQVPGEVIGTTTGSELDAVAACMSALVRANDLPEKVMVYHQFHSSAVVDEADLRPHPGVVLVKSIDGVGAPADKIATWNRLTGNLAPHIYTGSKLFDDEDARSGPLMTATEVLGLRPQPSYVLYE